MVRHRATALCSALAATVVCVIAWCTTRTTSQLPENLEPVNGAAQCNYELLHAFTRYIDRSGVRLRYSIGAGTLLGAMRNQPPGLLQWEHDVDVYMPARDAFELLGLLANECCSAGDKCSRDVRACGQGGMGRRERTGARGALEYRGLMQRNGSPCCGCGFKLFHRTSDACELDVLVSLMVRTVVGLNCL